MPNRITTGTTARITGKIVNTTTQTANTTTTTPNITGRIASTTTIAVMVFMTTTATEWGIKL